MPKFILINRLDYKYIDYPAYAKTEEALYSYLWNIYPLVEFTTDADNPISIGADALLYCCNATDDIVFGENVYIPDEDMQAIIDNEFDGNAEAFIEYLTENNMLVVGTEFDEEFKSFMWDIVYAISEGESNIDIDFDDLFVSVHQQYGIDTAIDCVERLL